MFSKKYRYYQRKRPIYQKKWFWKLVFILFIFCGIFSLTFYLPVFQIEEIKVVGDGENNDFLLFYQSLVSNQNIFFYYFSNLNHQLLKLFPDIKNISVGFIFPNKVDIEVQERKAVAFVCTQSKVTPCFIMDDSGILYKRANLKKGDGLFLIKSKLDSDSPKLPIEFLSKAILKDISLILEVFKKNNLDLSYFELNFDDLIVHIKGGSVIYFSKKDIQRGVLNLSFVFEKDIIKPGHFKIIDLRSEKDRIIFY